jgi:50S ribosomal protein L16 3-hydroxylase
MDWQAEDPIAIEELRELVANDLPLCRNPASRFSFIRQHANSLLLFVDGQCFKCTADTIAFAEQLCAHDRIRIDPELIESDAAMTLIAALLNQGSVAFDQAA